MITVDSLEVEAQLASLLAQVEENGETIFICRNGKPVAELKAPQTAKASRLTPHPELSKIVINYDPTEPATEADWPSECSMSL